MTDTLYTIPSKTNNLHLPPSTPKALRGSHDTSSYTNPWESSEEHETVSEARVRSQRSLYTKARRADVILGHGALARAPRHCLFRERAASSAAFARTSRVFLALTLLHLSEIFEQRSSTFVLYYFIDMCFNAPFCWNLLLNYACFMSGIFLQSVQLKYFFYKYVSLWNSLQDILFINSISVYFKNSNTALKIFSKLKKICFPMLAIFISSLLSVSEMRALHQHRALVSAFLSSRTTEF